MIRYYLRWPLATLRSRRRRVTDQTIIDFMYGA